MKLVDISGTKKKGIYESKIDELETIRSNISGTCIGASVTIRRVTSLELGMEEAPENS